MKLWEKIPWGIVAGLCGVIVFYTITATVVVQNILGIIAGATTEGAGLFGTWYQTLLFVCDIVFGLIFLGSLAMYILRAAEAKKHKGGQEA